MNAQDLLNGIKREGAKKTSPVLGLLEDGRIADIIMVEADDGAIYLKLEVSE